MGILTTTKKINPSQLTHELMQAFGGTRSLRVVGPEPDGTTKLDAPGTGEENLASAVDAHVADDQWVDPNPSPLTPDEVEDRDTRDQMAAIRAKAKAVFAGTDTFTAAQSQKILAALVLRMTR